MDNLLQGYTKNIWNKVLINEWERLSYGNDHCVASTYTIEYIEPSQVFTDRIVTYVNSVCDHRPLKTDPRRERLVVGGEKLPYEADAGLPASNLIEKN